MLKLKDINQVITAFLAAGGLGYINYWILEKLDVTSSTDGEKTAHITFSSLLCSIPDFFIYLVFKSLLNCIRQKYKLNHLLDSDVVNFLALILTIVVIIFITSVLGKKIIQSIYWILRKLTTGKGNTGVAPGEPWTAIDKTHMTLVYLYSLDHKPIAYGYGESYSGGFDSNYSVNLQPAEEKCNQPCYQYVVNCAYFKDKSPINGMPCKESHIHVNLSQGFIMIIFKVRITKDN